MGMSYGLEPCPECGYEMEEWLMLGGGYGDLFDYAVYEARVCGSCHNVVSALITKKGVMIFDDVRRQLDEKGVNLCPLCRSADIVPASVSETPDTHYLTVKCPQCETGYLEAGDPVPWE
jgi:hypothetical protein